MRALELAEMGRMTTWPNPWVGCVVVKNGDIIGEGFHRYRGEPHAEPNAIRNCKIDPHDADVYVTLEPCSHYGLTPPCCELLNSKKVKRVYVALEDPDEKVKGRGIRFLNDNGIETIVGLCRKEVERSMRPYLHHRLTGMPFVVCKVACGLNGNISCIDNSSQWITGDAARSDVHKLRAESQAVMVGIGTVLADNPKLTVRGEFATKIKAQPLRVILDPSGKSLSSKELNIHDEVQAPSLIVTSNGDVPDGASVFKMPDNAFDMKLLLAHLGKRGILQVLVEGGAETWTRLIEDGLVNQMVIYQAPKIMKGKNFFHGLRPSSIKDVTNWKLESSSVLGEDIKIELTPPSCII